MASHEIVTSQQPHEKKASAREVIKQKLRQAKGYAMARALIPFAERKIIRPTDPQYEPGFFEIFDQEAADPNVLFVVVSGPHEEHADGIVLARVANDLSLRIQKIRDGRKESFPGFLLTIAASIDTPDQSPFMMYSHRFLKPRFKKYHMETTEYVRKVDRIRYPDTLGKISNRRYVQTLNNSIEDGHGLIYLPEATVESGRMKEGATSIEDIKGMQPFESDFIALQKATEKKGKRIVVIPAGTHGSFRLQNSEEHSPRPRWKPVLLLIIDPRRRSLVEVKLGKPMRWESLIDEIQERGEEINPDSVNSALGRKVALLVPLHARGVFA